MESFFQMSCQINKGFLCSDNNNELSVKLNIVAIHHRQLFLFKFYTVELLFSHVQTEGLPCRAKNLSEYFSLAE